MTIDVKKNNFHIECATENTELKTLKNVKWGALIKETLLIQSFIEYARPLLQSKTIEDIWKGSVYKRDLWHYYYISRSVEEPILKLEYTS